MSDLVWAGCESTSSSVRLTRWDTCTHHYAHTCVYCHVYTCMCIHVGFDSTHMYIHDNTHTCVYYKCVYYMCVFIMCIRMYKYTYDNNVLQRIDNTHMYTHENTPMYVYTCGI